MDAVEFFKEKARMCKNVRCLDCQLQGACDNFITNGAYELVVKAVERWAKENPRETRLSKLLKQYPKAKAECIKEYYSCPAYLGYSCPGWADCKGCWDIPIDEEEQE